VRTPGEARHLGVDEPTLLIGALVGACHATAARKLYRGSSPSTADRSGALRRYAALGRLAGAGRLLPAPHLLVAPYLAREAVASSRIEGTQASLSDVFEADEGATLLLRQLVEAKILDEPSSGPGRRARYTCQALLKVLIR